MNSKKPQKSSNNKKSVYIIEYRLDGVNGFLLSKKNLTTFEEAKEEREKLIKQGATEALIKKR